MLRRFRSRPGSIAPMRKVGKLDREAAHRNAHTRFGAVTRSAAERRVGRCARPCRVCGAPGLGDRDAFTQGRDDGRPLRRPRRRAHDHAQPDPVGAARAPVGGQVDGGRLESLAAVRRRRSGAAVRAAAGVGGARVELRPASRPRADLGAAGKGGCDARRRRQARGGADRRRRPAGAGSPGGAATAAGVGRPDRQPGVRDLAQPRPGRRRRIDRTLQLEIDLPLADRALLQQMFVDRMEPVLTEAREGGLVHPDYWVDICTHAIDPFLRTPRDVVRLVNATMATYSAVRGEVNPIDFTALETLRLFCPVAYDAVRRRPDAFLLPVSARRDEDGSLGATKRYHEAWGEQLSEADRSRATNLLLRLFPRLGDILG